MSELLNDVGGMEALIGSWIATTDVPCRMGVSAFTIPKGAIVAITQIDKGNNKVLVSAGPRDIDWKHTRFLNDFEPVI